MKILLFGKTGQLGQALQVALAPLGQLIAPDRTSGQAGSGRVLVEAGGQHGPLQADFLAPAQLLELTLALAPNIIINAAACTAVDAIEDDPATAMQVNAQAPAVLAQAAIQCNALFIHYSTDYVFDGTGTQPWVEADVARPLNLYGRSKLAADQAIMHSGCRHLIFRTSWVYSDLGHGFLQQMMQLALQRDCLRVVNDQIGAPTSACLIANVTVAAIEKYFCQSAAMQDGLYHLAASGQTSRFDYARYIFARMQSNGLKLELERVVPVSTLEYGSPARRPLNSRLDSSKLCNAIGLSLPGWQYGVEQAVDALCGRVADGLFLL